MAKYYRRFLPFNRTNYENSLFNASMEIPYRHNVLRIFSFTVSQIVKGFANLNHLVEQESILTTVISSLYLELFFEIAFIVAMVSNVSYFTTYIKGDDIETLF